MNLNELVWSKQIPVSDKLNILSRQKLELDQKITNRKKLRVDFYHVFPEDFDKLTDNNKWKEIVLAIEIVKNTKRWDRKYNIELKKKESGNFFITYFKNTIYLSDHHMYDLGINYRKPLVTYKTMIIWANKLAKTQVISNTKFNMFMEYLEDHSYIPNQETIDAMNEDLSNMKTYDSVEDMMKDIDKD